MAESVAVAVLTLLETTIAKLQESDNKPATRAWSREHFQVYP